MSMLAGNRYYLRAKSPLTVVRNFQFTEPATLATSLPPLEDERIKSGMLITVAVGLIGNQEVTGFRVANAFDSTANCYVALHDYDDRDVQASGKMQGLPCREKMEVQTGYYDISDVTALMEGTRLTVGDGGVFEVARVGDYVLATVSAVGSNADGSFPSPSRHRPIHTEDPEVIQIILQQSGMQMQHEDVNVVFDESDEDYQGEDGALNLS